MNNEQFRKIVLDTPARANASDGPRDGGAAGGLGGATPRTLGSKLRSNIPMTPRSVGGVDFARQLAEARHGGSGTKKFRSSAAPKGAKLPAGYRDRARDREGDATDGADDRAARVQALEEMMKLQQIDYATFVHLRDQIVGGDIGTTHLIKGLDWKLLERVKRGEDVLNGQVKADEAAEKQEEVPENVDKEFDELEGQIEVKPVVTEKVVKKGQMAPPPPPPSALSTKLASGGKKRSRDEILAELKASRRATAAAQAAAKAPSLGPKFKKVGAEGPERKSRIERDERGREILITVDEDGNVKRKVKRARFEDGKATEREDGKMLLMPDKDAQPLGMEAPTGRATEEEEDDDVGDIFEGVGADYQPLGDEESSEDGEDDDKTSESANATSAEQQAPERSEPRPPAPPPTQARNYFSTPSSAASLTSTTTSTPSGKPNALTDPTILAALRKASAMSESVHKAPDDPALAQEKKHRSMIQNSTYDRDAEDMDLGFGGSRFEDGEDADMDAAGKKGKLSVWGGLGGEGKEGREGGRGGGREGKARKRGPKKRMGDKDSADDVLSVLEGRRRREKS